MLLVMRSTPRKFATEVGLYNAATRALMRRAYSLHEMKEYLKARAENPEHAATVLQKLKERNYVDDARYARDFARFHAQSRRQGKFRIARELRVRGVPDRHIEEALESIFAETDEKALIRVHLERKLRQLLGRSRRNANISTADDATTARPRPRGPFFSSRSFLDERTRASIYRSLLRAGFSPDAIHAEMRSLGGPGIDERLEPDA